MLIPNITVFRTQLISRYSLPLRALKNYDHIYMTVRMVTVRDVMLT
jgi:hypothetical protein